MTYTQDDIQILDWFDAIRRRPAMYIGDTSLLGLLFLMRDLLDVPLDPSAISMTLAGPTLRITASSVPPSVEPRKPGRPPFVVEACMTLSVALDQPATLAGIEMLDESQNPARFVRISAAPSCLAIANALSESFVVASISEGVRWYAEFAGGVLVKPLAPVPSAEPRGLSISFTPDPRIFGATSWRFALLAGLAREVALLRRVPVQLRDDGSGACFAAGG